jgi:hypothetical protein
MDVECESVWLFVILSYQEKAQRLPLRFMVAHAVYGMGHLYAMRQPSDWSRYKYQIYIYNVV